MNGAGYDGAPGLQLTFLGQMGFRIQCCETVVYLDPFLSNHPRRQVVSPLSVEDLCDADIILGSHDHKDHIDRAAWPRYAQQCPRAVFVVPELLLRQGLAEDLKIASNRFVGMTNEQMVTLNGIRITAVASAHEFLDQDRKTGFFPYLGYVVEWKNLTLYHAGDTCRYEGLESALKKWDFDVMILPINGRDAERYASGCIGNLTYQEAVDLVGDLSPRLAIPGHWDLFANNAADPADFMNYLKVKFPAQQAVVLDVGHRYVLPEETSS